MSRIHEALKRAAEERAAKVATEVETGAAEVIIGPKRPVAVGPAMALPIPPPPPRVTASSNTNEGFSYEELLKRSVQQE